MTQQLTAVMLHFKMFIILSKDLFYIVVNNMSTCKILYIHIILSMIFMFLYHMVLLFAD